MGNRQASEEKLGLHRGSRVEGLGFRGLGIRVLEARWWSMTRREPSKPAAKGV